MASGSPRYRWSTISPADIGPWADLCNLLATADQTEEFYEPEDLLEELQGSTVDPSRDTWAVWEGEQMVAYGQVFVASSPDPDGRVRAGIPGGVHPDHRGVGIGRRLISLQEDRAAESVREAHPGAAGYWRTSGHLAGHSVRSLLEHRGYRIGRYFHLMALDFSAGETRITDEDLIDPPAPFRVRAPQAADETAVHRVHTAAFADHWGSSPMSAAVWHDFWGARSNRWPQSSLVEDSSGRVAAYVLAAEWVPGELYLSLIGSDPALRGRGLARTALRHCLQSAAAAGYGKVDLHVDSDSPTGATRLYESVGFEVISTSATYLRPIPD